MMEELTRDTDTDVRFDNVKISDTDQDRWGKYVVGFYGITQFAQKALDDLVEMAKNEPKRVRIFFAAMRGREWMYKYQFAEERLQRQLSKAEVANPKDYWNAVIEAVELAQLAADVAHDFKEDLGYFIEPIPDTKIKYQSPTTRAIYMETV
jgi:hypothetical protein